MEPTFFGGDLVIARKMPPSIGDVIVYAPEGLGGSQIVHRIIGGNAEEGWRMQGDNNSFVDPFTPKGGEVKGVVLVHYANFGRVTVLLLNPMVWAFVLLAAMVLMLWWTGDDCDDDDDDDDSDAAGGDREPESEPRTEPDLIDRVVEGTEAAVARMVAVGRRRRHHHGPRACAAGLRAPRHAGSRARGLALGHMRGAAILAVLGLTAIIGSSTASAAQLTVNAAGEASFLSVARCAAQNLAVTPSGTHTNNNYGQVTVTGIAAACLSKPISVYLHNSAGAIIATFTGTTPTSGSTMALTLPGAATFDAAQVTRSFAKVKGWVFVGSWSYTPVPVTTPIANPSCDPVNNGGNIPGGKVCTVSNTMLTTWTGGAGNAYQYKKITFTVASEMDNFRVTFDLGDSSTYGPWTAGVPTHVWSKGQVVAATVPTPAYSCSALPTVSLNRSPSGNLSINDFEILVTNDPSATPGAGYTQVVCP